MIVLLNSVFNFSKSLLSLSADKVTTGTYNFVSVILNAAFVGAFIAGLFPCASLVVISIKTQFLDHVKIRFTSQLITGISKVLQKLSKCFSSTTISTSSITLLLSLLFVFFPTKLLLYLNDAEFVIGPAL